MVTTGAGDQKASKDAPQGITEDEAALYDRQIRLWGVDAQNRLRNSTVLLAGMSGVGAEIAKNLMLAGLKRLTLLDDHILTTQDQQTQFLAPYDALGQNRAQASKERCQQLNTMVELVIDESALSCKIEEGAAFFSQFHLVCLVGATDEQIEKVDHICRYVNVKFVAAGVNGYFGYGFSDFGEHQFVEEVTKPSKVDSPIKKQDSAVDLTDDRASIDVDDDQLASAERRRKHEEEQHDKSTTSVVKQTVMFPSWFEAMSVDWGVKGLSGGKAKKMLPTAYFPLRTIASYRTECGTLPTMTEESLKNCDRLWTAVVKSCKIDPNNFEFTPEKFLPFCQSELSPVCAIVGGIMGQEIIKALSHKDRPLMNTFMYDGVHTTGTVTRLPPIDD